MYTVSTSWCSSMSMIYLSSTDLVDTVGEVVSSFGINSLCLLPSYTLLTFRVLSLFYLR